MRVGVLLQRTLFGAVVASLSASAATANDHPGKTIDFAMVAMVPAIYQTADAKLECPAGLHQTNKDNWLAQYPTEQEQAAFIEKRIHLAPYGAGADHPEYFMQFRGPQGQISTFNPELFKDLPLREIQSKVGYGLNLDGTSDGRATPKTCKHEKFAAADGPPVAIDNQIYRILGCAPGWRKGGYKTDRRRREQVAQVMNRVLFRVSDVDDEMNDDDVKVTVYKGIDPIQTDGAGKAVPGGQQRIDVRYTKYTSETHGKIVNGVLTTDPVDQYFAVWTVQTPAERYMRGMRYQLTLNPTGAKGLAAGYEDLRYWWMNYAQSYQIGVDALGMWDPPALYEAANRLADGYLDPTTGRCTAISFAYDTELVRANIVMPRSDDPLVTNPSLDAAKRTVQPSPQARGESSSQVVAGKVSNSR